MRRVLVMIAFLAAGCVEPATSQRSQQLCAEGDDGCVNGWTALQQHTADVAGESDVNHVTCYRYTGRTSCTLSIDSPGHWLVVNCWRDDGGEIECDWFIG